MRETCINWSCSIAETLLRRTDTFHPICFLYTFHPYISKAKTVKRTLLQTDNFFQSSDKKATCLERTQIKVLEISKKQKVKLNIFVNFLIKKTFFTLQNNNFFSFHFAVLTECNTFESNSVFFYFFQVALCKPVTNKQLFWVTESDIGQGPPNHVPPLYELLVSAV